jgi:hypothetical protein
MILFLPPQGTNHRHLDSELAASRTVTISSCHGGSPSCGNTLSSEVPQPAAPALPGALGCHLAEPQGIACGKN